MANKKFFERIKKTTDKIYNHASPSTYEDEVVDSVMFGNQEEEEISEVKSKEESNKNQNTLEQLKEHVFDDDDFGGVGESVPIDFSNLPDLNLNMYDEENEENNIIEEKPQPAHIEENNNEEAAEIQEEIKKEEIPTVTRRRGRPKTIIEDTIIENPTIEDSIVEDVAIQNKEEHKEIIQEVKQEVKQKESQQSQNTHNNSSNKSVNAQANFDLSSKILDCVCKNTIKNLSSNYKSQMYTKEYTEKLFNDYLNGKINASNPLFEQLILECIESNVIDVYLGDLTKDILNYIGSEF